MRRTAIAILAGLGLLACRPQAPALSEAERAAIADSVSARVRAAFEAVNRLDIATPTSDVSTDPDVRIVENGSVYPSLDRYRQTWDSLFGTWASLTSTPTEVRVVVLGPDAAAVTTPFRFTVQTKRDRTVQGQGVWTMVWQRRGGRWKIVQSHESILGPEQFMRALAG